MTRNIRKAKSMSTLGHPVLDMADPAEQPVEGVESLPKAPKHEAEPEALATAQETEAKTLQEIRTRKNHDAVKLHNMRQLGLEPETTKLSEQRAAEIDAMASSTFWSNQKSTSSPSDTDRALSLQAVQKALNTALAASPAIDLSVIDTNVRAALNKYLDSMAPWAPKAYSKQTPSDVQVPKPMTTKYMAAALSSASEPDAEATKLHAIQAHDREQLGLKPDTLYSTFKAKTSVKQEETREEAKSLREVQEALQKIGIGLPHEEKQESRQVEEQAKPNDPYPQNPKRVAFRNLPERQRDAIRDSILDLPSVPTHIPIPNQQCPSIAEPCYKPYRFSKDPAAYTKPFCQSLTDNPTVFHFVDAVASEFKEAGYTKLSERDAWSLKAGGKYYVERNGSSLIAFSIGDDYVAGNGAAMLAGHVDALTAKLKPIPKLRTKAGYVQLGVAPYAGGLNSTWWDRDLGIGGRVLVKESSGKVVTKLVKLPWPIARIPTLAPHFGAAANGPFNPETQMVPIIGLDNSDLSSFLSAVSNQFSTTSSTLPPATSFTSTQPDRLVKAIAGELSVSDYSTIVNWELELFDVQPATTGGLDHEFIFAGRIDDKLCSWAAVQALLNTSTTGSGIIKLVGLFDDEEVGSGLRQGAKGNFLPSVMERIVETFAKDGSLKNTLARTYANSFLVSSDVIHAVNPNFLNAYLENHSPRLNTGVAVTADANAHMTTDSVSTAILQAIADKRDQKLQIFQIRNDTRSGGTVGPMLSSQMGVRAVDAGIVQLSMHSIRATTGSLDPGLGVVMFQGFLEEFEGVDKEFRDF